MLFTGILLQNLYIQCYIIQQATPLPMNMTDSLLIKDEDKFIHPIGLFIFLHEIEAIEDDFLITLHTTMCVL